MLTNSDGRIYKTGLPLPMPLRYEAIHLAASMPIREVGRTLRILSSTVSKYVKMYREKGNIEPCQKNHIRTPSKLSFDDAVLLETIVQNRGSTSLKEMQTELSEFGDCGDVSTSTISRHVRNRLPSMKNYSRKRMGKCASARFTHENLIYTELYLDYLAAKTPLQ
ncbi:paired box Pax-9 isoform X2 [Paramuricea clavata]|uniref:Paired box Pax-9 isoform X2 n=1 Tax=Paramuricea clavata TaxID=317549 RepID=A0A6S7FWB6_PARCT|nr:paired box Pax-9 isoform X2 [Paramuricea clavata]